VCDAPLTVCGLLHLLEQHFNFARTNPAEMVLVKPARTQVMGIAKPGNCKTRLSAGRAKIVKELAALKKK